MKSFKNYSENDEILDETPKEAVDEAATMGDLVLGLGAVGALWALKKGWDKFGKGGKLARTLAITQKGKAQVAKDVTAFLVWAAAPHLEARHKMGFKVFFYLIILLTLVYLSKQKVWSRFGSKSEEEKEEAFDKAEKMVTEYEGEDPKTFK